MQLVPDTLWYTWQTPVHSGATGTLFFFRVTGLIWFYEDFHKTWCKQEMFSPSNSVRCLVTLLFSHGGTFRSLSKYGGKVGGLNLICPVQFQLASHYFWGCWTVVDCRDLPIYAGDSFHWGVFNDATLPETYIAPANGWLEYLFPFRMAYLRGQC